MIHISPRDASSAGVTDGTTIRVTSPNGTLVGRAKLDESVRPGAVWVPHGWPQLNVAQLTSERREVDPLTGMVVQTGLSVAIEVASPESRTP